MAPEESRVTGLAGVLRPHPGTQRKTPKGDLCEGFGRRCEQQGEQQSLSLRDFLALGPDTLLGLAGPLAGTGYSWHQAQGEVREPTLPSRGLRRYCCRRSQACSRAHLLQVLQQAKSAGLGPQGVREPPGHAWETGNRQIGHSGAARVPCSQPTGLTSKLGRAGQGILRWGSGLQRGALCCPSGPASSAAPRYLGAEAACDAGTPKSVM